MKYYLNGLGILIFIAITFGFAAPALVSAKDSLAVISGFAWIAASPVVAFYWAKKAFFKKAEKEEV